MAPASDEVSEAVRTLQSLPRVVIVSRRTVRKNKFVDFVGEYHLDLIVGYGAAPVIVPRVPGIDSLLDAFEPIHGVLLCEGEDIDPSLYQQGDSWDSGASSSDDDDEADSNGLTAEQLAEVAAAHASDTTIDHTKDSIEIQLARRCLERSIPYFGICRGSQVLNVACGGTLFADVETELTSKKGLDLKHIHYDNYDDHRHPVHVLPGTPLHEWFRESLQKSGNDELIVNSYHHQGVRLLAPRLRPMALAPDGLIEGFYDPDVYDPPAGKFIVGLQFHPERMRRFQEAAAVAKTTAAALAAASAAAATAGGEVTSLSPGEVFDYPECPRPYKEFVSAVVAFERRVRPRVPMSLPALPMVGPKGEAVADNVTHSDRNSDRGILSVTTHAQEKAVMGGVGSGSEDVTGVGTPGGGAVASSSGISDDEVDAERRRRAEVLRSFSFARVRYTEKQTTARRNMTERGASSALQVLQGGSVSANGRNFGRKGSRKEREKEEERELQVGADFLEGLTPLSQDQVLQLNRVGATLRNSGLVQLMLQAGRTQRQQEEGEKQQQQQQEEGEGSVSKSQQAFNGHSGGCTVRGGKVLARRSWSGRRSVKIEEPDISKLSLDELQGIMDKYQSALQQVQQELERRKG